MTSSNTSRNVQETFRVFQKVSVSRSPIEEPGEWDAHVARMQERFLTEYRLPPSLFQGLSVLDVGCGTGEKSLTFASWGATVTGIDYNDKALDRARRLAGLSRYADRMTFWQCALPDVPQSLGDEFGLCHVDGVLHHLANPYEALITLMRRVKAGGWLIIRNYQSLTALQRLLKRVMARVGTDEMDEAIEANVLRLFREDVERSVQLRGRGERQTIYDNFVVPQYQPFDLQAIIEACRAEGFQVYAAHPLLEASAWLGPGSLLPKVLDSSAAACWWYAVLARAVVATEPAVVQLSQVAKVLEECAEAAKAAEEAVHSLIATPTAAVLGGVVVGVKEYLKAYMAVMDAVQHLNRQQVSQFIQELEGVTPALQASLATGQLLPELPTTEIVFRKMSGMPMASWVVRKVAPAAASPFQAL